MMEPPRSGSDRVAELLESEPELDELTRARMEKSLLASVSAGEHLAPELASERPSRGTAGGRRVRVALGALSLAAAAVFLVLVFRRDGANEGASQQASFLRYEEGRTAERGELAAGRALASEPGERFEVRMAAARVDVTPESEVRFTRLDAERVEVELLRGSVEVELHPARRGEQTLRVTTERAFVDVVGTVFRVSVDDGDTVVNTLEGTVRVTPRDGSDTRLVRGGEETRVGATVVAMADAPTAPPATGASALGAPSPSASASELESESPSEPGEDLGADPRSESPIRTENGTRGGEPSADTASAEDSDAEGEAEVEAEADADPATQAGAMTLTPPPTVQSRFDEAEARLDEGDHIAGRRILGRIAATTGVAAHRVRAHTLIAESFTAQHRYREAAMAYAQAVAAGGHSVGAQNALFAQGRLYERQMRDRAAAVDAYRRYLELAPGGAHADHVHAALCNMGQPEHCP